MSEDRRVVFGGLKRKDKLWNYFLGKWRIYGLGNYIVGLLGSIKGLF